MHDFSLDTTMTVDLGEVKKFILSDNFTQCLLNNLDFPEAAYILQKINEIVDENLKELETE